MHGILQGFISQTMKMDPIERARRWKRSLDGYITFRKAVLMACCAFAFFLYFGPWFFGWFFRSRPIRLQDNVPMCVYDKLKTHTADLASFSATSTRSGQQFYLPYVGNGYFSLAFDGSRSSRSGASPEWTYRIRGHRTLSVPVSFSPEVHIQLDTSWSLIGSSTVTNFVRGLVHRVDCYRGASHHGDDPEVSISQQLFAHRAIPNVMVQQITVFNPSSADITIRRTRIGVIRWDEAKSHVVTTSFDGSSQTWVVFSGPVTVSYAETDEASDGSAQKKYIMVVVVIGQLEDQPVTVQARMTHSMNVLSAIAYSAQFSTLQTALDSQSSVEQEAIKSLQSAMELSSQTLHFRHVEVWKQLWTTGFGISHSMADHAINGDQINATMYYVLSQVATPLHSLQVSATSKAEFMGYLAYLEGCYGGVPTLHASNLWTSLQTVDKVNLVVKYWILTLEKNGCHQLIRAGADGVVQAMVLSFAGLKFHHQHLELNSHPKDLHRDYQMRRVSYGNATHLNISVEVQPDNRAVLKVALDRMDKDYFACDAGCLDPPVKLSTEPHTFPVKLTDPVTAVLYITYDQVHMQELKHAIHVNEVADAPAHEHHVIALHRHGNKLGGLPNIFWFSVGFLILVFHLFLFKLIWQEYCSNQDNKFRTRKFSDYE